MMNRKTDDPAGVYFQTGRVHNLNGKWYFMTREGRNIGPFESREEAEKEIALFLSRYKSDSSK